mmetsp:Transcript_84918/g.240663  ORF Transcript_84918/g.240663 Transcript_84918/m.240663 type:complete len:372 (+) Transcript_84918:66-1181(+)
MCRPTSAVALLLCCLGLHLGPARSVRLQSGGEALQRPSGELQDEDPELPEEEPQLDGLERIAKSGHSPGSFKPDSRCSFIRNLGEDIAEGKQQVLFMLGDSTMRGLAKRLCFKSDHQVGKFGTGQVTHCSTAGLVVAFYGRNEGGDFSRIQQLDEMEAAVGQKPDAIVFNGRLLHFLHMIPVREWYYEEWANLEVNATTWLDAVAAPGRQIVFKNTNAICEDKYTKRYRDFVKSIRENPAAAAAPCQEFLGKEYKIDAATALEQCKSAFFVRDGSLRLNQRMEKVLEAWQQRHPDVQVKKLDSFAMTDGRCEYTQPGDGRHYYPLSYNELNQLWAVLGWSGPVDAAFGESHHCDMENLPAAAAGAKAEDAD